MPFMTYDSKQGGGFEPLNPGEYEVIISDAKIGESKAKNPKINLTLVVRNDVEQEHAGRKVFDNLSVTPAAMFKFHNLSKGLEFEEGVEFDTLEDYAVAILHKGVRIKTSVKVSDYSGEPETNIVTYKPTQYPLDGESLVNNATGKEPRTFADPFADDGKPIDISDDDLPF